MKKPHPDLCAVYYDEDNKRFLEFHNTMLINQVSRDAIDIGKSFDRLLADEMRVLSKEYTLCTALLFAGRKKSAEDDDTLRLLCVELLTNTMNSLAAAVSLLRSGYTLQPGIIIRTCIEALAVVLHLLQKPSDLQAFQTGQLKSQKTINSAKKVLPIFGNLYGSFSDKFTHISEMHCQLNPLRRFEKGNEALIANLQFIASGLWLTHVTSELAFIESVRSPRYWVSVESPQAGHYAYSYCPGADEMEWMFNIGEGSANAEG